MSSFFQYAEDGSKKELAQLISEGFDVNTPGPSNRSALHCAAMSGHTEIVALLLSKGATVNCQTNRGATPLHYASRSDQIECVALLLENNADVNCVDTNNATPLHSAITYTSTKTALALINNYGADINAQNNEGSTPLHMASQRGFRDVMLALLEKGAKVDVRDNNGDTPFSLIPITENIESITSSGSTLPTNISSLMYTNNSTTTTSSTNNGSNNSSSINGGEQTNKTNTDNDINSQEVSNSGLFSDITFIVDTNKLPAHKCIMSARSEYFKKLLLRNKSESSLEIKETSFKVFQSVIDWIYNDTASSLKKTTDTTIDLSFAMQLLVAAVKFMIQPLIRQSEQFLIENVTSTSIGSIWSDLRSNDIKTHCPALTKHCANLLCKNWNVVGVTKSASDMSKQEVLEMVNLLSIQPAETTQQPAAATTNTTTSSTAAQTPKTKQSGRRAPTSTGASTGTGSGTSSTPTKSASQTPTRSSSAPKGPSSPPTGDTMDKKNVEICKNITQQIHKRRMADIFHYPVDPVALNIPHYFEIIKNPMDLSLIQFRLDSNFYKSIKDYAADMRLMFDNAMLFNQEVSIIYKNSKKLLNDFNKLYWDHFPFEKSAPIATPISSSSATSTPVKQPQQSIESAPESHSAADKKRKSMDNKSSNSSSSSESKPSSTSSDVKMSDLSTQKKYTDADRKDLMELINHLNEDQLTHILEIIDPKAIKKSDEGVEIDMYEVGDTNLAQLEEFINSCLKRQKKD